MEQVADRCVALLEQQPEAGAVLCRYMVSEGAPAGTALALAESLQTLLLNSKGPEREDEDDEGEAAPAPLVKPAAKQPKKKGALPLAYHPVEVVDGCLWRIAWQYGL